MIWVSDDGRARAEAKGQTMIVDLGDGFRIALDAAERGWYATWHERLATHALAIRPFEGELLLAHVWIDPFAEGTEPDPRTGEESWTLARLIEVDT